jgi:cytochrome bd ubiquinol oxidase subunit II
MDLPALWFVIIAVLWAGFLFLEGFDFGVGVLAIAVTRDEDERTQALEAIGPVWDADEVWLITAAAAIFAAFPRWYAELFAAAYLPLLLVIVGLVVRAVSVEYRLKRASRRWQHRWDIGIAIASASLPFLFGVLWAGLLQGLPLQPSGEPTRLTGLEIISWYSILGGLVVLAFSLAHGAAFLALKTLDPIRARVQAWAARLSALACVLMAVFAAWTFAQFSRADVVALAIGLVSVLALAGALLATIRARAGLAFVLDGVAILAFVAMIFTALAPNAIPSSISPSADLTLAQAAASPYPLAVMTIVTAIAFPVVLAYQGWSFWVFRQRVARPTPVASAE